MEINRYAYVIVIIAVVMWSHAVLTGQEAEEEIIEAPIPTLVQQELDRKLSEYHDLIMERCIERATQDAERYVDSLVAEEIRIQAADTIRFPTRPIKPQAPDKIILNDSTPIVPIRKRE